MKITFLLCIVTILCFSCGKEYLIPENEVPEWLKERISADEEIIKSEPKLMQNYGAWFRYKFKGDYYYEYDNPLTSLYIDAYSHAGERINLTVVPLDAYREKKCCEKLVWEAPNYRKFKP